MRLILVRHAETEMNILHILDVQKINSSLSEKGKRQAEKVGQRLKEEKIDRIFVSDLRRTIETAEEIIKHHPGVEVSYDPLLREQNMGIFDGKPYMEMRNERERLGLKRSEFTPEGGESMRDVQERMRKFLDKILGEYKGKTVLVVTHGIVIVTALLHLLSFSEADFEAFLPENTAVTIVELDFEKRHKLVTLNSVKHLL